MLAFFQDSRSSLPTIGSRSWRVRLVLFTLLLALLDQASKWLAKAALSQTLFLPVIPNVFRLTLTYNTGAAFSLFQHHPEGLAAFSLVLFLAFAGYALSRPSLARMELWAFALILGGALGNLLDRLLQGRVTDFFDCIILHYPVFNVADSFIFCGMILLLFSRLRNNPNKPQS